MSTAARPGAEATWAARAARPRWCIVLLAALGVLGGVLAGVGLGYALVGAINSGGLSFPYVFPAGGIALACVVGLAFGVLAALLPARRAARLDIIAALRWE